MSLTGTVPVLPVTDVAEAGAFYAEKLGFTVAFEQGPYVGVVRDGVELHLDGLANEGAGKVCARIEADEVDELHAELEPRGIVAPDGPLRTMPWGMRQFDVLDCCGNRVTFFRR